MNRRLSRDAPELRLVSAPGRAPWRRWPQATAALVIVAAAFLIRGWQFGNPMIHVDEEFYLLVGDRLLHGALPYVDIWDRKPVGLFLLFAGIRLLGGGGIVQYQVVATLFAAGTAIVLMRMARHFATLPAATVAGVLYLLMLPLANGMGGQAPVFYNLFVAAAALLVLGLEIAPDAPPARVRWTGAAAMLLVGIAMQMKYSALFEGVFLGIVLLAHGWRARRPARLAADAALWIGAALLPTALALGWYCAIGQGQAFLYANFLSIGDRGGATGRVLLHRLGHSWTALCLPLFCVVLAVMLERWRDFPDGRRAYRFTVAWLGAALLGYALFGTYFDHYALPLMAPIAAAAAPLFCERRRRLGPIAALFMLVAGGIADASLIARNQKRRGGRAGAERMVAAIRPYLKDTLFIYDGDTILYYLTGARIPTRYAFPSHLNLTREADAIGVDPLAEVRRVMATRPSVVVDTEDRLPNDESPDANAQFGRLVRFYGYREVAQLPHRTGATVVWARSR